MDIDAEALIAFTQQLVRIPSVHDPATGRSEEPVARLVAATMREWGWSPVLEEVAPGRPNVICTIDGGLPGPTLLFEGHSDVVTEGDLSGWTVDPFGATIVDGRLYGRGAADMKGGVAAMLFAARALAADGPFPGRLRVAVLVDEEGLMLGAKHFVARGHADDVDAAICCEPEAGEVCHVAKGALRIHVTFTGAMAHGAMPHQGRNPLPALATFVSRPGAVPGRAPGRPSHRRLPGRRLPHPDRAAGRRTGPDERHPGRRRGLGRRAHDPGRGPRRGGRPTRRAGGQGRLGPRRRARPRRHRRPARGAHAERRPDHAVVLEAHEDVTGEPGRLGGVPGATDGTVITSRAGVPSIVYGPGGKWIAHQADEFVEVAELVQSAEVYRRAAQRFLALGDAGTPQREQRPAAGVGARPSQRHHRRGGHQGRPPPAPGPRLADRHDGGAPAARDGGQRRRARRWTGHPRDRPARSVQPRAARPRGVPLRRECLRPRRRRRGHGLAGRSATSASWSASSPTTSCPSCPRRCCSTSSGADGSSAGPTRRSARGRRPRRVPVRSARGASAPGPAPSPAG